MADPHPTIQCLLEKLHVCMYTAAALNCKGIQHGYCVSPDAAYPKKQE